MPTNHSNTASDWLGHADNSNWIKRFDDTVSTVREAIDTGLAALHDYRRLAVHGIAPQEASRAVFQKHFADRK